MTVWAVSIGLLLLIILALFPSAEDRERIRQAEQLDDLIRHPQVGDDDWFI
jgi:hypothetical protein